ncbi:MAG: phospho-sugar mutase [Bacteroidota bacterium]
MEVTSEILEKARVWTGSAYDAETRETVQNLVDHHPAELAEAFHQDLEFGTGGLRGIMGVGTNRINPYTVAMATQGLSNYLLSAFPNTTIKVAVAHDSRLKSPEFARKTAEVFAANGFEVYLFDGLRPTPELSFAIRHLGCKSGVVITASHNPKEYNGYKAYWEDGGQVIAPHDRNIIEQVRQIAGIEAVKTTFEPSRIHTIGAEVDQAYLKQVQAQTFFQGDKGLNIVYTPLHGSGVQGVPQALEALGYSNVELVPEQAEPDGNFPTVHSPNPEEQAALDLAMQLARANGADLVMGTDPDADRVGIAVRDNHGELVLLNGNQVGAMIVHYLLLQWQEHGRLTGKEFVTKTIVTTDLINDIARHFDVTCYETLTGFKHMAKLIRELEGKEQYIGGGEESYGYMIGDFVRDKDAVMSAVIIAEIAAWANAKGSSFFNEMLAMYQQFGCYREFGMSLVKKGIEGAATIRNMMTEYRENPPKELAGMPVVRINDFQAQQATDCTTGTTTPIDLPVSNVLQYITADGSKATVRPSGTEPKIKYYISVKGTLEDPANYDLVSRELEAKIAAMKEGLGI